MQGREECEVEKAGDEPKVTRPQTAPPRHARRQRTWPRVRWVRTKRPLDPGVKFTRSATSRSEAAAEPENGRAVGVTGTKSAAVRTIGSPEVGATNESRQRSDPSADRNWSDTRAGLSLSMATETASNGAPLGSGTTRAAKGLCCAGSRRYVMTTSLPLVVSSAVEPGPCSVR